MMDGVPLFRVELFVLLDFIVDGAGVIVGDILVDDLEPVGWEKFLYVAQRILRGRFLHH